MDSRTNAVAELHCLVECIDTECSGRPGQKHNALAVCVSGLFRYLDPSPVYGDQRGMLFYEGELQGSYQNEDEQIVPKRECQR